MNSPFSFTDILERIIPGMLCQMIFGTLYFGTSLVGRVAQLDVAGFMIIIAIAYAIGVAANIIAGLLNILFVPSRDVEIPNAVKLAITSFFSLDFDKNSWKYCYGIAHKHGHSAKSQILSNLDVFCRSMSVICAIGAVSGIITKIVICNSTLETPSANFPIAIFSTIIGIFCITFIFGARTYSHAFVGSIYQAFFSWYTETQNHSANTNIK